MLMIKAKMLALIIMIALIGCTAVTTKNELTFNSLIFDNQSDSVLENVKVFVEKTGVFASCGLVHRGPSCSTSFPTKTYQGNSIRISWQLQDVTYSVGPIFVGLPTRIDSTTPASIIIRFDSESAITTKFAY
jgi:hypothetical protein